jgi:hypothetical protein
MDAVERPDFPNHKSIVSKLQVARTDDKLSRINEVLALQLGWRFINQDAPKDFSTEAAVLG